jgi:fructokinase
MRERWGRPAEDVDDPAAWDLEAEHLAHGLANLVLTLSAERIVLGGGVGRAPGLIERIRARLPEVLAGYVDVPQLAAAIDDYLVAPGLGEHSDVIGAIELARRAVLSVRLRSSARPGAPRPSS